MFEKSVDKNICSVYNGYTRRTNVLRRRMKYMKKIVIKNKFRFICFLLASFTLISLLTVSVFNLGKVYGQDPADFETHLVAPGETVWSIAGLYNNGGDVRALVYEIQKINNINSGIYIGQEIKIPV